MSPLTTELLDKPRGCSISSLLFQKKDQFQLRLGTKVRIQNKERNFSLRQVEKKTTCPCDQLRTGNLGRSPHIMPLFVAPTSLHTLYG